MDDLPPPPAQINGAQPRPDESGYSLTVDKAAELFAAEGTPRSARTVRRYCSRGILDCVLADTENGDMWLISEDSVHRRVTELKQMIANAEMAGRSRPQPDLPGNAQSGPGEPGSDQPQPRYSQVTAEKIDELERELMDLKIANRGKDYFIEQLQAERNMLLESVSQQGRLIGRLEEKLQLAAPTEDAKSRTEPLSNPQDDLGIESIPA